MLRAAACPRPTRPRESARARAPALAAAGRLRARRAPRAQARPGALPAVVDQLTSLYLGARRRDATRARRRRRRPAAHSFAAGGDARPRTARTPGVASTGCRSPRRAGRSRVARHRARGCRRRPARRRPQAPPPAARGASASSSAEAREATRAELWRYTADLLFLVEDPLVRDGFFPTSAPAFSVEPAAAEADRRAIIEIVDRHQGEDGRGDRPRMVGGRPEGFRVARDRSGGCRCVPPSCAIAERGGARVIAATRSPHAGARTCAAGRCRASGACCSSAICSPATRRGAGRPPRRRSGSTPSACTWSCARPPPHLHRSQPARRLARLLEPLGFAELPGRTVVLDGTPTTPSPSTSDPRSVDGWLARLVASSSRWTPAHSSIADDASSRSTAAASR